jgi:Protein of unknown function (DUF2486)
VPDSSDTTLENSIPILQDVLVPGDPAHGRIGPDTLPPSAGEPAEGVTVHPVTSAQVRAFATPEPAAPFELPQAPEPFEPNSAFHFARTPSAPVQSLDADVLAERLRGRFASYLTGEGRSVIEARCRDALQDHTTWLVSQITREVALALETEMTGWVREAVDEEMARRSKESGITST